ncbi:MAG: SGNH/GDSL hydrolase family protein [Candidatus Eisenbacteria bacterium]|uniref:SGNH/GDSL hydrolase family protein n=1 Tax=Eiseniibacteriota bacterium TaxID=2212470 RepID=A0A956SFJ6_UNCEI|nr:SGNH/GDSL hydrolase family protein [Candidatus Eisenbacteria bacterium]MCB9463804.1 SGNH/GDSL hydrolase family protein [Candidatus Eisenbacteria bacterium]
MSHDASLWELCLRWGKHVLVFLLWATLTTAGLDLFIQKAGIQSPMENHVVERIGLMYEPNFDFVRFSEGLFVGGSNAYGCLGKGAPKERTDGVYRIVFLGDSFALGHTVLERHHFARKMEEVIREETGHEAEVLNFARADFSISNLYQHYVDFASQWQPDLALFFADDTDLDPVRLASHDFYPAAVVEGDSLTYDYSFIDSPRGRTYQRYEWLLHRTVLPRFVFEFLKVVDRGDLPHVLFDKLAAPVAAPPAPTVSGSDLELPEVTNLVLERLSQLDRVIVVLSGATRPESRQILSDLGIQTLDLNPVFEEVKASGVHPFYWSVVGEYGHWNQAAHQAIGQYLGHETGRILSSADSHTKS